MAEALRSQKLLNDFRDLLDDQGRQKVPSDGLIYKRLTDAQRLFMETYKISKMPWILPLFADQTEYPIPANIIEIHDIRFSREELNPFIELPNLSTDAIRNIIIENPTGDFASSSNMIREGDKIIIDAYWKPNDDAVIDAENDPLTEKTFDVNLLDHALFPYRDYSVIVDGKPVRYQNAGFKTEEQVISEVRAKRNRMYGLNSIQTYSTGKIRF